MKIEVAKPQRLYLRVAEQLITAIQRGTPGIGERLPSERELAQRFGVSRPTIREAMIALEIAGQVEIRSGSGVYVTQTGGPELQLDAGAGPFEILEARRLLERETAALAAQRISATQLAELEALLQEMQHENQRPDITEAADEAFHCRIAEAAGNSLLAASVSWLWKLRNDATISTYFHQRMREEGSRPIIDDHRRIIEALRARDPDAARAAMDLHLQRVVKSLMKKP